MPDDFSSLVDSSMPRSNPVGSFVQGINNGADWAHSMASLSLQQQTVQNQMANHQLMQQEFEFRKGQQRISDYKDLLGLDPGPYQNAKMDMFREMYPDTKETWMAAAKDPNMKETISSSLGQIDNTLNKHLGMNPDPDAQNMYKKLIGQFGAGFAQDLSKNKIEEAPKLLESYLSRKAMMDAMSGRQATRISNQDMLKGIGDAQKATANDSTVIRSMQEFENLLQTAQGGKGIANTPQLLSKLQAIEGRIANGTGKLTEGTMERQRADGVGNGITNLIQKITNGPQDAPVKGWENQILAESKSMMKSYMDDIDTHHDSLRNAYSDQPQATKAIDNYFNTLRSSMGKRGIEWEGYKAPPKQTPTGGPAPAQTPAAATGPTDEMKATARQVQGIFQQNLSKAVTPEAKAALIKKAKSLVDPSLADAVVNGGKI